MNKCVDIVLTMMYITSTRIKKERNKMDLSQYEHTIASHTTEEFIDFLNNGKDELKEVVTDAVYASTDAVSILITFEPLYFQYQYNCHLNGYNVHNNKIESRIVIHDMQGFRESGDEIDDDLIEEFTNSLLDNYNISKYVEAFELEKGED